MQIIYTMQEKLNSFFSVLNIMKERLIVQSEDKFNTKKKKILIFNFVIMSGFI